MHKSAWNVFKQTVMFALEASNTVELVRHLLSNETPSFQTPVHVWFPYSKNFEIFIDCLDNALRVENKNSVVKYQFHQKTHFGKRVRCFNSASPTGYKYLLYGLSKEHNIKLITPHKEGELDIEISITRQRNTNNFDIIFTS